MDGTHCYFSYAIYNSIVSFTLQKTHINFWTYVVIWCCLIILFMLDPYFFSTDTASLVLWLSALSPNYKNHCCIRVITDPKSEITLMSLITKFTQCGASTNTQTVMWNKWSMIIIWRMSESDSNKTSGFST